MIASKQERDALMAAVEEFGEAKAYWAGALVNNDIEILEEASVKRDSARDAIRAMLAPPDDAVLREDFVLVHRDVLSESIGAMEKIYAKQITMNNGSHRRWLQTRVDELRSYLEPSQSGEATR